MKNKTNQNEKKISSERVKKLLTNQKINYNAYLELYCPAIDWILQCVCSNRTTEYLKEMLEKFVHVSNQNRVVGYLFIL